MPRIRFGELLYGAVRECPIYADGELVGRIVGHADIQKTQGVNRGQVYRVEPYAPIAEPWIGYRWFTYTMAKKAIRDIQAGRPINRADLVPDGPDELVRAEQFKTGTSLLPGVSEQAQQRNEKQWREEVTQRLQQLDTTEIMREQMGRTEQGILRDGLFKDKASETCAICGKEYTADALRAAHKKNRSECSEDERRDINIVAPLCLFGCDYLYEKRHVRVENGIVQRGVSLGQETAESQYIEAVLGREVDQRWLRGAKHYFWN